MENKKLTKEAFVEALKHMSVKEVMDLVHGIKETFGIDPTAAVAAAAGPADKKAAAPTEVSVILKSAGQNKVAVIKAVKEITGLGLIEAKGVVDAAPKAIKEKIKPEEAELLKAKLVEAGAEVEIK